MQAKEKYLKRRSAPNFVRVFGSLLPIFDVLVVASQALFALYAISILRDVELLITYREYWALIVLISIATPLVFYAFQLYESWRGEHLAVELVRVLAAWGTLGVIVAVVGVLTKTNVIYSRLWLLTWFLASLVGFWALRIFARRLLSRIRAKGRDTRSVLLVGSGETAARAASIVTSVEWTGFRLVGYVADEPSRLDEMQGVPYYGMATEFMQSADFLENLPDQVWMALDESPGAMLRESLPVLSELPVEIRIVPEVAEIVLLNLSATHVGGLPMLRFNDNPLSGVRALIKDVGDRLLSVIGLVAISPLMLIIALSIKISSGGPIFFRQMRHGWLGEEINVYKFCTMRPHEEKPGSLTQAKRDDWRITTVGKWLRRTNLDELPQLLNVIKGEMSLVGPRPHAVEHNRQYKKLVTGYMLRHKVKPGLTGWAQVNGYRGEVDNIEKMRKRIEYDLYYIENWSPWFDIVIILLTLLRGFRDPNAY